MSRLSWVTALLALLALAALVAPARATSSEIALADEADAVAELSAVLPEQDEQSLIEASAESEAEMDAESDAEAEMEAEASADADADADADAEAESEGEGELQAVAEAGEADISPADRSLMESSSTAEAKRGGRGWWWWWHRPVYHHRPVHHHRPAVHHHHRVHHWGHHRRHHWGGHHHRAHHWGGHHRRHHWGGHHRHHWGGHRHHWGGHRHRWGWHGRHRGGHSIQPAPAAGAAHSNQAAPAVGGAAPAVGAAVAPAAGAAVAAPGAPAAAAAAAAPAPAESRPAFDPASRHSSGRIDLSPSGYKNNYITDWGYAHDRQWVDVRGAGVRNDYGRWVGVSPHVWYSIALYECPNQYSGRGEFILVNGRVERGPKFRGTECNQPQTEKRVYTPAPNAPWQAKPMDQPYFADVKSARARLQAGQSALLSCPSGQVINVKDATFGAGAGVYQASGFINKGSCHAANSHQVLVDKCNNKESCSVPATVATFGADPCSQIADKELIATYGCSTQPAPTVAVTPAAVQTAFPGIKVALFNTGADAALSCSTGEVVNVLDASYGQKQGFYLTNGYIDKSSCHSPVSAGFVGDKCHGKASCAFKVDAAELPGGSDCTSAAKTLKVTYRCDKKAAPFVAPSKPAPRQFSYVPVKAPGTPASVSTAGAVAVKPGDNVLKVGNSEIHLHIAQLSVPEPNAKALNEVEDRLDALHESAMGQIDTLLSDIEEHRKAKRPCLKKLQNTIANFKQQFVSEAANIERITHKYSYSDDAPTLV